MPRCTPRMRSRPRLRDQSDATAKARRGRGRGRPRHGRSRAPQSGIHQDLCARVDGKTGPILVQQGVVLVIANLTTTPLVTITQIKPIKVSASACPSPDPAAAIQQRANEEQAHCRGHTAWQQRRQNAHRPRWILSATPSPIRAPSNCAPTLPIRMPPWCAGRGTGGRRGRTRRYPERHRWCRASRGDQRSQWHLCLSRRQRRSTAEQVPVTIQYDDGGTDMAIKGDLRGRRQCGD